MTPGVHRKWSMVDPVVPGPLTPTCCFHIVWDIRLKILNDLLHTRETRWWWYTARENKVISRDLDQLLFKTVLKNNKGRRNSHKVHKRCPAGEVYPRIHSLLLVFWTMFTWMKWSQSLQTESRKPLMLVLVDALRKKGNVCDIVVSALKAPQSRRTQ